MPICGGVLDELRTAATDLEMRIPGHWVRYEEERRCCVKGGVTQLGGRVIRIVGVLNCSLVGLWSLRVNAS